MDFAQDFSFRVGRIKLFRRKNVMTFGEYKNDSKISRPRFLSRIEPKYPKTFSVTKLEQMELSEKRLSPKIQKISALRKRNNSFISWNFHLEN